MKFIRPLTIAAVIAAAAFSILGQGGKAEPLRIELPARSQPIKLSAVLRNDQEMEYVFRAVEGQVAHRQVGDQHQHGADRSGHRHRAPRQAATEAPSEVRRGQTDEADGAGNRDKRPDRDRAEAHHVARKAARA